MKKSIVNEILFAKPIDERGRFCNLYDAQSWAKSNGYSIGNTCRNDPICLMKGEYD
jgi:hypothetical protein